jgi:competence protein ComEC
VTVLDVGQGDALLVDLPNGAALLVDGGGMVGSPIDVGARVIQPVLRARRRSRVEVVVLSHPHPDHFGGLISTLPLVDVGEIWDTGQGEENIKRPGLGYATFVAAARRKFISIRGPANLCGPPRAFGGARVSVLAPCPSYVPDASANNNSFVLRVEYRGRAALLVGDSERERERLLVSAEPVALRADFLKVGHHGSRTSSSWPFLSAVHPTFAAISAGARNRFGHPDPTTLTKLRAIGAQFARTDRDGAIVWETDGRTARLWTAR